MFLEVKSSLTFALFYLGSLGSNVIIMSRTCQITGKKTSSGNNRPFSLKITKRTFRPNLFKKKMYNPMTGKVERMTISAKGIKTLKKWAKEGAAKAEAQEVATTKAPKKATPAKAKKLTPKQKKEQAAAAEAAKVEAVKPTAKKKDAKK